MSGRGEGRDTRLRALALVLLVLVAYGPTLTHGFVWDDYEQILDNPHLRSWSEAPSFFTGDLLQRTRLDGSRSNYYRPLFLLQLLATFQIFGSNAFAWHALAILVHLAACFAAWAFARRLGLECRLAWTVALLFALHPAHGESVAWLAASFNDPAVAILVFCALSVWFAGLDRGSPYRIALSGLLFLAALGFKESAIAAILLAPLCARFFRPDVPWRRIVGAMVPWVAAVAIAACARRVAIGAWLGHYPPLPGWSEMILSWPRLGLEYARYLVWPWDYSPTSSLRLVADPAAAAFWLSSLTWMGLCGALLWISRRFPPIAFGFLWSALAVAPALHVRGFRPEYLVHQRYLYLAVLGFVLPIAVGISRWSAPQWARTASVATLSAVWIASLWVHNPAWRDDRALWTKISETDPANEAAFDWLGTEDLRAGRIDEAERQFRRSILADPDAASGACNLATVLWLHRRDARAAIPLFERAAAAFEREGSRSVAREACEINLALALHSTGEGERALARLQETARRPPHSVLAHRNAAALLVQRGEIAAATAWLAEARRRHPEDPQLLAMQVRLLPPAR